MNDSLLKPSGPSGPLPTQKPGGSSRPPSKPPSKPSDSKPAKSAAEYLAWVIDQAPPLTQRQRAALAILLRPASKSNAA